MAGRAFRRVRGRAPGVVALALAFVLAADGALAEEPAASSAAAAAETRGSSAGGGGATITDVPSPAVNCMTPPVEQRVKPEYPADMLRMKEGSRIPVELVFTDPAAAPEINFPKDTGDAFEDAVRAYARTLRIPCMKHDAGAVKLRQEFTFVPNDGRKVGWTTPIDEANTEHRCLRLPSAKDARLAYPPDLLRSDRQGTVVVVLHFHAADAAPTYDLLYDGGHRHFAAAVQPYIDQLRLPCFSGQPYDIGIHFNFRIAGESYRKRIFNDLQLPQFLQVVKPIPAGSAFYDTTTMNCPFDVRLTFRQPYATNRVEELGADVPARHAFIDWLARQEIDTSLLGKIPAAELLDQDMTIHVPCATIDL